MHVLNKYNGRTFGLQRSTTTIATGMYTILIITEIMFTFSHLSLAFLRAHAFFNHFLFRWDFFLSNLFALNYQFNIRATIR